MLGLRRWNRCCTMLELRDLKGRPIQFALVVLDERGEKAKKLRVDNIWTIMVFRRLANLQTRLVVLKGIPGGAV